MMLLWICCLIATSAARYPISGQGFFYLFQVSFRSGLSSASVFTINKKPFNFGSWSCASFGGGCSYALYNCSSSGSLELGPDVNASALVFTATSGESFYIGSQQPGKQTSCEDRGAYMTATNGGYWSVGGYSGPSDVATAYTAKGESVAQISRGDQTVCNLC